MMQTAKVSKKNAHGITPRDRIINAARRLFGSKGFHTTRTAELATEAAVSPGQVYRHFDSKEDIIIAVAEDKARAGLQELRAISGAVERGELSPFDGIKTLVATRLGDLEGGLFFEIVAEACRNSSAAESLKTVIEHYHDAIRRLAMLAKPNCPGDELDAYVDLLQACLIGLYIHPAIGVVADLEKTSRNIARLMLRALGVAES
jgi:TetR/AcrR family transcriptional repressor of uid operon